MTTAAGRKHLLCLVRELVEGGEPGPPADEIISLRVRREGLDHSLLTSTIHPPSHPNHHNLNMSSPSVRDLTPLTHTRSNLHLYHMCRKQDGTTEHLQVTQCSSVICGTFCKGDKTAVEPNKSLYSIQLVFVSNQRN